jgi:ferredoxin-NADP reductase
MKRLPLERRISSFAFILLSLTAASAVASPEAGAASCVSSLKSAINSLIKSENKPTLSLTALLKKCSDEKIAAAVCDEQVLGWLKGLVEQQKLPLGTEKKLAEMIRENPRLADYLSDSTFVEYAKGVAQGKTLKELRPTLFKIWKNAAESGEINLGEGLTPGVLDVMKTAEAPFAGEKAGLKFSIQRFADQIKAFPKTMDKIKGLINKEMDPSVLDSRIFDFYGYLNLELDASRIRSWNTVQGGYKAINLNDVKGVDPTTWSKVSMLASEIEIPIGPYSDNSGETLRVVSPQASRFMGKTSEEAIAHQGHKVYCTNSWCTEENRHANVLEQSAKGIVGYKLKGTAPFDAYQGLDPLNPQDAFFHLVSRNDTEWHAGSAYYFLGGHADKALGTWIGNVREDELKHMSLFGGLYKYIFGDTYNNRLSGMLKKALQEANEKGNSEFGDVFATEPVAALEMLYTHVLYEKKIREFFKSLPLKSLRKIYETEVKLPPLKAVEMDPKKAEKIALATTQEESRRKGLARWPKKQREAAEKLEYFEINNKDLLDKIIVDRYGTFKGAEVYKNPKHVELMSDIEKLTSEEIKSKYGVDLNKDQLALLKKSVSDTLRDYQIMNNPQVQKLGLNVRFVDSHRGFDVVRDEAYARAKKVEDTVAESEKIHGTIAPAVALTQQPKQFSGRVFAVEKVNDSSHMISMERPEGLDLKPGEAIRVTLDTPSGKQVRTLSLASSPSRNYLEFAVRDSDSDFKTAFKSLKAGDPITVQLAKGSLNFKPDEPAVMIAGGIGITPFRSMIQYAKDEKLKTPMWLYYGNRDQIAFGKELDKAASTSNKQLNVTHVLSKAGPEWQGERGRVDEEFLKKTVSNLPGNANYYIVGPSEMVMDTKKALTKLGIPEEKVQIEVFPGYNPAERKVAQAEADPLPDNQTVCFCHSVSAGALRTAIKNGASTLAELQTQTMATTGCGSCECNVMGLLQCEAKKLGK